MQFNKLLLTGLVTLFSLADALAQNLNVAFNSQLTYPNQTLANIYGYVDTLGNEYALVGASLGMSIVDITNPANPVEVIQIPGPDDLWKEIKVRGKYAYITTEGGDGLQIVNLSSLPDVAGITYHNWTGDGAIATTLNTIHSLHIDGDYVYLYGSNLFNGGAIVADLTDPWNPTYVGKYEVGAGNAAYVHDGYVRNDTLYAGHIYSGYFSVVDFTNKANPVELANQFTPNNFTHNTWLSNNSNILFTTDEVDNSFLTTYDISDLSNITELDRLQSNPGSGSMVHNTHIINVLGNDYAVTSWYKDGFTIVDAARPHNLIQVGNYDTFSGTGGGFDGAWGVYPYFPSGTIVVSNINEGLFVFTPNYLRACYLEGIVSDSVTGLPINNVTIEILSTSTSDNSKIAGDYATGLPSPGGIYSVKYSKAGYYSKIISGLSLVPAQVTNQNVLLAPLISFNLTGNVVETGSGTAIANANVRISNTDFNFVSTTDANGNFSFPAVYDDTYEIITGKWGYITTCTQNQLISSTSGSITIQLDSGYYDDFSFDFGWTVNSTASTGAWERGIPLGTIYNNTPANPGADDSTDCSNMAYITGNTGLTQSDDDIDNGSTLLKSPVFDLTNYTVPYLDYTRWFYNDGGSSSPNDSLSIYLSNGTTTALVEFVLANSPGNSSWVNRSVNISDYITPTATMQLSVRAVDENPGHLVEAGFDNFLIKESPTGITENVVQKNSQITVFPNPFSEETSIAYQLKNKLAVGASITISDITGRTINRIELSQAKGIVVLNPSINAGIYFVRMNNGIEIIEPVKIVKVK